MGRHAGLRARLPDLHDLGPGQQQFGVLPAIWGTLYSSLLALMIGGFFGVAIAIFLTQDFLPPRLAQVFRTIVELLAAIPSVVYGLWGIFVVIPAIRPVANWLLRAFGWIPFFGTTLSGPGLVAGGAGAGDHGAADGRGDLAGRPPPGALQGEGGRLRPGRHPLGGDPEVHAARPRRPASSAPSCWASAARSARPWRWRCWSATPTRSACRCSRPPTRWPRCSPRTFRRPGHAEVEVLMYAALVLLAITLVVNIVGDAIMAALRAPDRPELTMSRLTTPRWRRGRSAERSSGRSGAARAPEPAADRSARGPPRSSPACRCSRCSTC